MRSLSARGVDFDAALLSQLLALELRWPDEFRDVDDWLTVIGSGKARGITAASTAHQYRRRGVVYRAVRDAPPVPVYLAWSVPDAPRERQSVIDLLAALYGAGRI